MALLLTLFSSLLLFTSHILASEIYGFTWPPQQGVNVTQGQNVTISWPAQPESIVKNTTLMIWQGFSNGQGYYETSLLDAVKVDPGHYTWNVQMLNNETSEEDTHFELQYGNGTVLDSGTLYIDNPAYNSSSTDTGNGGDSGGSSSVGITVGGNSNGSNSGSGDGISIGLDVGLGLGIPVVIFTVGFVWYLIVRKKRRNAAQFGGKLGEEDAASPHSDVEMDEKPILGVMEMPAERELQEADGIEKWRTNGAASGSMSPGSPYPQQLHGEDKRFELSAPQNRLGRHELPAARQDEVGRCELPAK